MDLARAYRTCARITRREARNFYFAFLSLPRAQRHAVYALYAFCREADDIADAPADGLQQRREGLFQLRKRLVLAARGQPETLRDAALTDAIDRFGVDPEDLADVVTGVEMDLEPVPMETFEELRSYCYHVASAVGLATLPILNNGIPPSDAMREAGIALGLGMQLANILRDVAEDLDRERVYLPAEELERFGVAPEALRVRVMSPELHALFSCQYERAKRLLAEGRNLIPAVPQRSRGCLWLLSEIYGRILERIASSGFDVFAGRVSLPATEKLWLLLSVFWRRL